MDTHTAAHLGRYVVGGTAEGACGDVLGHVLLTHAKVGNLDVSLGVQHHVVQLQVPAEAHVHTHTHTHC